MHHLTGAAITAATTTAATTASSSHNAPFQAGTPPRTHAPQPTSTDTAAVTDTAHSSNSSHVFAFPNPSASTATTTATATGSTAQVLAQAAAVAAAAAALGVVPTGTGAGGAFEYGQFSVTKRLPSAVAALAPVAAPANIAAAGRPTAQQQLYQQQKQANVAGAAPSQKTVPAYGYDDVGAVTNAVARRTATAAAAAAAHAHGHAIAPVSAHGQHSSAHRHTAHANAGVGHATGAHDHGHNHFDEDRDDAVGGRGHGGAGAGGVRLSAREQRYQDRLLAKRFAAPTADTAGRGQLAVHGGRGTNNGALSAPTASTARPKHVVSDSAPPATADVDANAVVHDILATPPPHTRHGRSHARSPASSHGDNAAAAAHSATHSAAQSATNSARGVFFRTPSRTRSGGSLAAATTTAALNNAIAAAAAIASNNSVANADGQSRGVHTPSHSGANASAAYTSNRIRVPAADTSAPAFDLSHGRQSPNTAVSVTSNGNSSSSSSSSSSSAAAAAAAAALSQGHIGSPFASASPQHSAHALAAAGTHSPLFPQPAAQSHAQGQLLAQSLLAQSQSTQSPALVPRARRGSLSVAHQHWLQKLAPTPAPHTPTPPLQQQQQQEREQEQAYESLALRHSDSGDILSARHGTANNALGLSLITNDVQHDSGAAHQLPRQQLLPSRSASGKLHPHPHPHLHSHAHPHAHSHTHSHAHAHAHAVPLSLNSPALLYVPSPLNAAMLPPLPLPAHMPLSAASTNALPAHSHAISTSATGNNNAAAAGAAGTPPLASRSVHYTGAAESAFDSGRALGGSASFHTTIVSGSLTGRSGASGGMKPSASFGALHTLANTGHGHMHHGHSDSRASMSAIHGLKQHHHQQPQLQQQQQQRASDTATAAYYGHRSRQQLPPHQPRLRASGSLSRTRLGVHGHSQLAAAAAAAASAVALVTPTAAANANAVKLQPGVDTLKPPRRAADSSSESESRRANGYESSDDDDDDHEGGAYSYSHSPVSLSSASLASSRASSPELTQSHSSASSSSLLSASAATGADLGVMAVVGLNRQASLRASAAQLQHQSHPRSFYSSNALDADNEGDAVVALSTGVHGASPVYVPALSVRSGKTRSRLPPTAFVQGSPYTRARGLTLGSISGQASSEHPGDSSLSFGVAHNGGADVLSPLPTAAVPETPGADVSTVALTSADEKRQGHQFGTDELDAGEHPLPPAASAATPAGAERLFYLLMTRNITTAAHLGDLSFFHTLAAQCQSATTSSNASDKSAGATETESSNPLLKTSALPLFSELINHPDLDGRTPLHAAALEGQAAVVRYLLAAKARADASDRWGRSAADDAAARGHTDVLSLLLQHSNNNAGGSDRAADIEALLPAGAQAGAARDLTTGSEASHPALSAGESLSDAAAGSGVTVGSDTYAVVQLANTAGFSGDTSNMTIAASVNDKLHLSGVLDAKTGDAVPLIPDDRKKADISQKLVTKTFTNARAQAGLTSVAVHGVPLLCTDWTLSAQPAAAPTESRTAALPDWLPARFQP